MADVIYFTPRMELDAEANLRGFVQTCRTELTAFGAHLRFDDDIWDVTDAVVRKARYGVHRLVFSTLGTVNDRVPRVMSMPFLGFAKAYMRYQHALRPTTGLGPRISAVRALESALAENGKALQPTSCSPEDLHRAAHLIRNKFTASVAYRVGQELELLGDFLINHQLVAFRVRWRNPIGRPGDTARVGKQFDEQRYNKLPSPTALGALATVFRAAAEPSDILVSSIAAILCSAPDRINEVLRLEVDCEVTERVPSSGTTAYGLRWRSSKGGVDTVKWIVPAMAGVVQDALSKIRRVTQEARVVSKWYESRAAISADASVTAS
jgi:hypothetical protein